MGLPYTKRKGKAPAHECVKCKENVQHGYSVQSAIQASVSSGLPSEDPVLDAKQGGAAPPIETNPAGLSLSGIAGKSENTIQGRGTRPFLLNSHEGAKRIGSGGLEQGVTRGWIRRAKQPGV